MTRTARITLVGVVGLSALPALALLGETLVADGSLSGATFSLDARQLGLLARSLLVATTATGLALVWGLLTASVITRLRGPLSALLEVACYVPLLLPRIVLVIGWMHILGPGGTVSRWMARLTDHPDAAALLCTPWGAGFVLSLCTFPFVTIACAQGFRAVDETTQRAARLVAGPGQRAWRIWRPAMTPYVATGALLVFLVSFSDYSVPSALMVNVYPVEVFAQLSSFHDEGQAMGLALVPFLIAIVLCGLRHAALRTSPFPASHTPATVRESPGWWALSLALGIIIASSLGPLLTLAIRAGGPATYVRAMQTAGAQILSSLRVAAWGTLLMTSAALVFALAYRKVGRSGRIAAETAVLSLLMVPGAVVGLGILVLKGSILSGLRDHALVVALAATCRFLAFPALLLAFAVTALRPRILQAAAICGAGPVRTALRIGLPLVAPTLLAAGLLSFLLTLTELTAAVLVYPPGAMTLPVRLASLLHFGEESIVAALCVMLGGFSIGLLILMQLLTGRPLQIQFHGEHHD